MVITLTTNNIKVVGGWEKNNNAIISNTNVPPALFN